MEINNLKKRSEVKTTESPIEEILLDWLNRYQIYPEIQYEVGHYRADFYLEDLNLVIEADGREYHSSSDQIRRDGERDKYMKDRGYTVLRIPGWLIKNKPYDAVKMVLDIYYPRKNIDMVSYGEIPIEKDYSCMIGLPFMK